MTLTMDHVEMIPFDSFTTLVDGHGSTERILRQYGDDRLRSFAAGRPV